MMSPFIWILFSSTFFIIPNVVTYDYNDPTIDDHDDETQVAMHSARSSSEIISNMTTATFDFLSKSNNSLKSVLFSDQTIDFNNLGISFVEPDTFINYQVPVATIIFSSNFISYLPRRIFLPFSSTLQNLNIQRNQFQSLRHGYFLRHLSQLKTLDLSYNRLSEISKQDFIGLRRLEILILRHNRLTSLCYACFSRCRTITILDLSDNQISRVDPNAFRSLYRLKTLLLANNPLGQRSLTTYLMEPLKSLEYLDLENTQLDDLPAFLFSYNHRLQSIKLRRNYFQAQAPETTVTLRKTFCQAKSLVEIDLVSTNLRSLDVCTYNQVPSLTRLYLMDNPLDCTCDLFHLRYGDIYRLLLTDGNGNRRENENIDNQLDRWLNRPELRRHLEAAYQRGDISRLPIDLSSFARCATPQHWQEHEIRNITGLYSLCRHRWSQLSQECNGYCQQDGEFQTTIASTDNAALASIQLVHLRFHRYLVFCLLYLFT